MDISARRRRLRDHAPALVDRYGSPLYVFFESDLRENYRTLRRALNAYYPDSTVHFATKANYNLGVLSVLPRAPAGRRRGARRPRRPAVSGRGGRSHRSWRPDSTFVHRSGGKRRLKALGALTFGQ
jgi:hypothetical protein